MSFQFGLKNPIQGPEKLLDPDIMSSSNLALFKQIRTTLTPEPLDRNSGIFLGEKEKKGRKED